jgi:hypothetical protein
MCVREPPCWRTKCGTKPGTTSSRSRYLHPRQQRRSLGGHTTLGTHWPYLPLNRGATGRRARYTALWRCSGHQAATKAALT